MATLDVSLFKSTAACRQSTWVIECSVSFSPLFNRLVLQTRAILKFYERHHVKTTYNIQFPLLELHYNNSFVCIFVCILSKMYICLSLVQFSDIKCFLFLPTRFCIIIYFTEYFSKPTVSVLLIRNS